jgi:hypothetical protein
VIAPRLDALVRITGTAEQPVRGLVLEGLAFEHATYDYSPRYAGMQACFHEHGTQKHTPRIPVTAAIRLEHAHECSLRSLALRRIGGSALWIGEGCRNTAVSDCLITNIGGNGINVGEAQHDQPAQRIDVIGNTIGRVGQRFFGAVGIWIGNANHVQVARNHIHHAPYTGISAGWTWAPHPSPCHHINLVRNHIHDCMLILSDGGGIYTLGRQPGTVLRENVIHDIRPNAGRAESNGVFFDQGTSELLVEDNVIYRVHRSPLRFHLCEENTVRDNTLVVPEGVPPYRYNSTDPAKITYENNHLVTPAQSSSAAPAAADHNR